MSSRKLFALGLLAFGLAPVGPARAWGQLTQVSQTVDPAVTAEYEAQIRARWPEIEEVRRNSRPPNPLTADGGGIAPVISPEQQAAINRGIDQPLMDSRGTALSPTTVLGLLLIRDMYVKKALAMADFFDSIREGGVGTKRERLRGITEAARELARLHAAMEATKSEWDGAIRAAGSIRGNVTEESIRVMAEAIEGKKKAAEAAKAAFQAALDRAQARYPEINVPVDGVPLWQALDRAGGDDRESEQDRIEIYNAHLRRGAEGLRGEARRPYDTTDELWRFIGPEFKGIRDMVRGQGESVNSVLPSNLMDEVEKVGEAYSIHASVDEGWVKLLLVEVSLVGVLISPALCLTMSVIDVTMEGDQLIVAFKSADEAERGEPVLGWRHVITAEERASAAAGEFVLAAVGVGLDVAAIRSMKVVGAADCPKDAARAGEAADAGRAGGAADAGAEAGRVGDAAGAGRAVDAVPKRWGHLGDATVDEAFGHPNIPDDAWVHFGGSEIADGIRQDGVLGRSYWGRWGEVKNWTQGELRFNIGSMSKSGMSDLKTMVVAPDGAPIRVKRGEYGFEVEGVTDETIQGGRVFVHGEDPAAAAGRVGAADAGRAGDPAAPGRPEEPPGPPRAGDVARGAPEPGGLRPDDVEHWRRNEAERLERDRGFGIERTDETDAKLQRFEESIQAASDAGIPRADIDEALDAVRRKQVSIPSEGQTPLDVAIKDFRIRMVIKEAIRKDITIVLRETDRVHLDALGGGDAKVVILEPADANLVIAKAATDRGQGATWTAAEAELARRLQRENPEKLYVFDPEQFEGGLYPLMDADDAANLSRIFGPSAPPPPIVDRGPGGPPPDLPQRPLDPEADTSLDAGRARQPADDRPPEHRTQQLRPGEVDESLRDAETVRIPGEADEAAQVPRPLLSTDQYRDLVARQAGGEQLDLGQIARPGIARALPDGRLGIAQGAGRWENARPDDWLDVFVDARTPLPEGAVILERGIDPELVRQANLLSSRGQEGTNPTVVGLATRDVPEFMRIRIRAGDLEVPTSKVASLIEDELTRLESEGVDVGTLRRAMAPLSPNQRLALLRDDAARARALAGEPMAGPAGAEAFDPRRDAVPLPAAAGNEPFDPRRDAVTLPAPAPGNQPGEIQAAPLVDEAADRPPVGAGNVPRAAEAGNVPTPDDREVPEDVPPAPEAVGGREVGLAPAAGDGNPQVASVGTTFQHTISPIDFYMFPVLDLSDQTYTAINFPVTLATGRDVRIQIVILSGPPPEEGTTRARRPGDPQPDRSSTRTSWIGESEAVPGGGILFFEADPKVLVRSLGTLGGGAMEMQVFGAEPGQERISAEGLVVEPVELGEAMKQRLEQEVRALAGQNPITARLDAYCLDFLRQPPDLGTVFRIADQELQQRFAPLRDVLQAGRRLHEAGLLNPDSDPEEYFHSIRQWALWSVQEKLDAGGFGEAFVEHTRKNFEIAGQPWTDEIEGLVKSLVPNRWQDVARILEEARSPSAAAAEAGAE